MNGAEKLGPAPVTADAGESMEESVIEIGLECCPVPGNAKCVSEPFGDRKWAWFWLAGS